MTVETVPPVVPEQETMGFANGATAGFINWIRNNDTFLERTLRTARQLRQDAANDADVQAERCTPEWYVIVNLAQCLQTEAEELLEQPPTFDRHRDARLAKRATSLDLDELMVAMIRSGLSRVHWREVAAALARRSQEH